MHWELWPGLLESAYEVCLAHLLMERGVKVERQLQVPVVFRGIRLDCGYRLDMLIEEKVIVENKTVESLAPIHAAQLLSHMRLARKRVGLLINYHVPVLKNGIKRFSL